jgi:hypothetical protein
MENEILDLIDRYWKFDDNQTPVSNWHDKQDLLEAVRKALRIHDVVGRREQLCQHSWVKHPSHPKIGAMVCLKCGSDLA